MSKFDYSDLDGRLLQLLVAVIEAGSITGAAQRLGVTQSAVSHLLDKLRAITGDPLFVKAGRGIVATAHAIQLADQARELLSSMERFATVGEFTPAVWRTTFTIAANDFQRDLLLPPLMARLREKAPGVTLRVIPSDIPSLDMLRTEQCQLARGFRRRFAVMVPGFAGLPPLLRGSQLLATVPSRLQFQLMQGLAHAPVPLPRPTIAMFMAWHMRHQLNASHRWLRDALEAISHSMPSLPRTMNPCRRGSACQEMG